MPEPQSSVQVPSFRWRTVLLSSSGAALLALGVLWARYGRRHRWRPQIRSGQSASDPEPPGTSAVTQAVEEDFGSLDDVAERLRAEFGPCELDIEDMTKPNWDGTPGPPRISLELVSDAFAGLPQSERQQKVRELLLPYMKSSRIDDYTALL